MNITKGQIWKSRTNSTSVLVLGVVNRIHSNKEVSIEVRNAKGTPTSNRYISKWALSSNFILVSAE